MPRLPEFEPVMYGMLASVPLEVVPLYAALAVVHSEMSGAPPNICVPVCFQLAGALEHLGFEAEVMVACATVVHRENQQAKLADIGVWDRPPIVRPDGTTDGHVVLWASSFKRLIDPTVTQAPKLLEAAHENPEFSIPVVLPLDGRESLTGLPLPATFKGPCLITWMIFPDRAESLTPMLAGELGTVLPYASLALAHTTLDVLHAAEAFRPEIRRLRSMYPPLGDLFSGVRELPPLPPQPPEAFERMRRDAST